IEGEKGKKKKRNRRKKKRRRRIPRAILARMSSPPAGNFSPAWEERSKRQKRGDVASIFLPTREKKRRDLRAATARERGWRTGGDGARARTAHGRRQRAGEDSARAATAPKRGPCAGTRYSSSLIFFFFLLFLFFFFFPFSRSIDRRRSISPFNRPLAIDFSLQSAADG
ncbi:hypothetical protein GW17_00056224, partial [Ensete ventricosum]